MKFDEYPLATVLKQNLVNAGLKRPTDIQYKAIPSILKGEDVLAIAQTGTGKTAAFVIPVLDKIHKSKRSKRVFGIQCIIMVPTRELAEQIGKVLDSLARYTRVRSFAVYGGVEQERQIRKLERGIDVMVATPGRMFDLISQGTIHLDKVRTLVLDEADRMLDRGFISDIKAIKKRLKQRHQTLFFSATINKEIKKLAYSQVKRSAIRIQISPDDPVSKNVSHSIIFVKMDDKRFFLRRFIRDHEPARILVFVRTKVRAERVAKALARGGIDSLTIHGGKDQDDRNRVMERFKSKSDNILIATDVSARGIDIPDVNFVVNYDLPDKAENYVHRVGRTGRGVSKGQALSFVSPEEKSMLAEIQSFLKKEIETVPMTRKGYADILREDREPSNIRDIILAHEAMAKSRKKRKKPRPKRK